MIRMEAGKYMVLYSKAGWSGSKKMAAIDFQSILSFSLESLDGCFDEGCVFGYVRFRLLCQLCSQRSHSMLSFSQLSQKL